MGIAPGKLLKIDVQWCPFLVQFGDVNRLSWLISLAAVFIISDVFANEFINVKTVFYNCGGQYQKAPSHFPIECTLLSSNSFPQREFGDEKQSQFLRSITGEFQHN